MRSVQAFNASKLSSVLQRLRRLLWGLCLLLGGLLLFFAYQWQQALKSNLTYFVTPEATYPAHRRPHTTDELEIKNFTRLFLQHAFAHNEFTYKDNLNQALLLMDRKSGLYLKSKFSEEAIYELYQHYNGVSTLAIKEVQVNLDRYPYEVAAYYQTTLHFVGLEGEEDQALSGGVYFQLSEVPRSQENPYGLLISQFDFIAYDLDKPQKDKRAKKTQ